MNLNISYVKALLTALLISGGLALQAQPVSWSPAYPTKDDSITIIFDATQAGGNLQGVSPVFAHTGVITQYSTDLSDWKHQPSLWTSGADPYIQMTNLGNDRHEIRMTPTNFYGISQDEDVRALSFVFRDATGSAAGTNVDGSDIFIPIYPETSFCGVFASPLEIPEILNLNDNLDIEVRCNQTANIEIFKDGVSVGQSSGMVQSYNLSIPNTQYGRYQLSFTANNGSTSYSDTIYYVVQPQTNVANLPSGIRDGINYVNNSTVIFSLLAPNKGYAYLIGPWSDWKMDPDYLMNKTPDGERFWIELTGLTPGQDYPFQYFIDHKVLVGDPYAELVLDPLNDQGINSFVFPNMPQYPHGQTSGLVTVFKTGVQPYNWQTTNFNAPDNRDLVIYELLVRDFVIRHDYSTVEDSLDYLQSLGVNAIELMPVNEFDGNNSWGYGPAYYFAPDKYYGTKESLQSFIDACHSRGIAVIVDVVFNHSFSQSPMVRMYYDKNTDRVTGDNPWYNQDAPHPLGLGYDFDHASGYTQTFVDSVLAFWAEEYRVDGFRFDLSKGFTNRFTGQDIGAWSMYDQDRINYLKRIADEYWNNHGGYMILEHFGNNDEETELANHGFMLWGNANHEYNEGLMGYEANSDFNFGVNYQARGWAFHNLVGYMESHDEERLMYRNVTFGNSFNANHDCKDTTVALERMGMGAALFFTIPGPKMIWQFGEYGYDYSIDFPDRTSPKPIRWDYLNDPRREYLMKVYAALIKLKTNYPNTFRSNSFDVSAWGKQKQVHVNADMNATVIANFDVVDQSTYTGFQHTGWWYEYLSGDSIDVTDVNMTIPLQPGEYRVFTDQRLPVPDLSVTMVGNQNPFLHQAQIKVFPNPSQGEFQLELDLNRPSKLNIQLFDLQGKIVTQFPEKQGKAGKQFIDLSAHNLPAGQYLLKVSTESKYFTRKLILSSH